MVDACRSRLTLERVDLSAVDVGQRAVRHQCRVTTVFFPKGRRFEMSKETKKQPPKPNARGGEARVCRMAPTSDPEIVPDLSHIAEALRPLAIPCSSLNPDPDNARLHSEENIEAIMKSLAE